MPSTTMTADPQMTFFLNDSSASVSVFHIVQHPFESLTGRLLYYRCGGSGESRADRGSTVEWPDARTKCRKTVIRLPLAAGADVPGSVTCPAGAGDQVLPGSRALPGQHPQSRGNGPRPGRPLAHR